METEFSGQFWKLETVLGVPFFMIVDYGTPDFPSLHPNCRAGNSSFQLAQEFQSMASWGPSKPHSGFIFLSGISLVCFLQTNCGSQCAVGYRGEKRTVQIFPVALPYVLCPPLGTSVSPGPWVVVRLPQRC